MNIYDATMHPATHPLPGMQAFDVLYQAQITDANLNLLPANITPSATPTMIDLESGPWGVLPYFPDLADRCQRFIAAADALHSAGRTDIGFFGALPIYHNTSLCMGESGPWLDQWRAANDIMAAINNHIDALYLPCYVDNQNVTPMEWVQSTQLQIKAARRLRRNQVRLVLRPTIADESGPVPVSFWSMILQFCRQMASHKFIDGIVIWDNPQRPFVAGLQ